MRLGEKTKTFLRNFLLPLPTGGQIPGRSKIFEIFSPLLLFGDGRCVLTNFRKTFSLPSVQVEKVPSYLPTGEEFEIWAVSCKTFSYSSAYKRKIHPNRTLFRSKKSRSCFLSSHFPLRMRYPFWQKIRKYFSAIILAANTPPI